MADKKTTSSSGIGFLSVMFLIFMTLKLCGVISWSWWWVTAPLWGGFGLFLGFILACAMFIGICAIIGGLCK